MNVLAIDTSNQVLGVAICKDGEIKAEYTANIKRSHSVGLMPAIDHIMKETETTPDQLQRIAVAKGPGSYTGVRIGLSTAKTMAWSLNIPIVAISSLELMVYNVLPANGLVSPFFDARRGLVYSGLYEIKNGQVEKRVEDQNVMMNQWLEKLREYGEKITFLSPDLSIHKKTIQDHVEGAAILPTTIHHLPRPGILALLGVEKQPSSVHGLTPNYLRLVEAEAKWIKEQEHKSDE